MKTTCAKCQLPTLSGMVAGYCSADSNSATDYPQTRHWYELSCKDKTLLTYLILKVLNKVKL